MTDSVETSSDFFEYVDDLLSCPLSRAIKAEDFNTVKRTLSKRKKNSVPLPADNRGWTALHVAASDDKYSDYLKLLLHNRDTVLLNLDAKTHEGETALYLACDRGCVKNCTILLGVEPDLALTECHSSTLLHIASENGHVAIVSKLIDCGSPLNFQDWDSHTPLHLASMNGHVEVVRVLMSKGANLHLQDTDGNAPLHLACLKGHFEIMKILLDANCSLIDDANKDGSTPLILAVHSHNAKCVQYLLDNGANADHSTRNETISLQYAARSGVKEILEMVLESTSRNCIETYCLRRSQIVLRDACDSFHSLMACVIQSGSPECMSFLLESGLPKSILQAPYIETGGTEITVYSPLALLFATYFDGGPIDELLPLLLRHDITYMNEFRQTIELESQSNLNYVNPFTFIFEYGWSQTKRDHYLNKLLEKGITVDYCLQCYVERGKTFREFGERDVRRFYQPIVNNIYNVDNDLDILLFIMINSVILEPFHLLPFIEECEERFFAHVENRIISNGENEEEIMTSNLHDVFENFDSYITEIRKEAYPNLQFLCRQVIRKHLRDETIVDILKNFRRKIDALPLPQLLKDFLLYKNVDVFRKDEVCTSVLDCDEETYYIPVR